MTPYHTSGPDPLDVAARDIKAATLGGSVLGLAFCAAWHAFGPDTSPFAYPLLWLIAMAWGREIHFKVVSAATG